MKLQLNSLAVDCVIGELPEERVKLQRLLLDIGLEIPDTASMSDELADTVDYAALARNIRTALAEAKCRMIERAAKVAADVCMADGSVRSVEVKVTKSGAVDGLESASASLTRTTAARSMSACATTDRSRSRSPEAIASRS